MFRRVHSAPGFKKKSAACWHFEPRRAGETRSPRGGGLSTGKLETATGKEKSRRLPGGFFFVSLFGSVAHVKGIGRLKLPVYWFPMSRS